MMTLRDVTITVKKDAILAALKKQREKFAHDYALALKGYTLELKEKLSYFHDKTAKLEDAHLLNDLRISQKLAISFPDNHLPMFDDLIGMLELSQETEFRLDHNKYKCWIKGEFPEVTSFSQSNTMLIRKAMG